MQAFPIRLEGKACMDIGASTGGFTDCMLQNGAKKVYAVDVGYGQLAWSLRSDPRVVNLERTNIRYVTPQQIGEPVAFASVDVSFISLRLVLPVVRDRAVHAQVLEAAVGYAVENGFGVLGMEFSPVKGPEGNIEYLMYLQKGGQTPPPTPQQLRELVDRSHQALDRPAAKEVAE